VKITKRQLRRIIKEEKAHLIEYGSQSKADRAIGMFFDVRMMETLSNLIDDMYENALDAAMDELGPDGEADEMVEAGMRKLFEEELRSRRIR